MSSTGVCEEDQHCFTSNIPCKSVVTVVAGHRLRLLYRARVRQGRALRGALDDQLQPLRQPVPGQGDLLAAQLLGPRNVLRAEHRAGAVEVPSGVHLVYGDGIALQHPRHDVRRPALAGRDVRQPAGGCEVGLGVGLDQRRGVVRERLLLHIAEGPVVEVLHPREVPELVQVPPEAFVETDVGAAIVAVRETRRVQGNGMQRLVNVTDDVNHEAKEEVPREGRSDVFAEQSRVRLLDQKHEAGIRRRVGLGLRQGNSVWVVGQVVVVPQAEGSDRSQGELVGAVRLAPLALQVVGPRRRGGQAAHVGELPVPALQQSLQGLHVGGVELHSGNLPH
eukprot:RCo049069